MQDSKFLDFQLYSICIYSSRVKIRICHQNCFYFSKIIYLCQNDSRYRSQEDPIERKWKRKFEKRNDTNSFFSSSLFFFSCRATLMEEQRSIFHANGVPLKYSIHRVTRACPPSSCRVHSSAFFLFLFSSSLFVVKKKKKSFLTLDRGGPAL